MNFAGWVEILVIVLLTFVIIGPKDLPKVLFMIGRFVQSMKRLSNEFMSEFEALYSTTEVEKNEKPPRKKKKDEHHITG